MSFDGSCEIVWGGDKRRFRLGIEELLALQEKRKADGGGPMEIAKRLYEGRWQVEDVTETLRIALIGGGTEWKAAEAIIEAHARPGRLGTSAIVAYTVLVQAVNGDPDNPVGKTDATTDAPGANASPPSPSTAAVP